LEKTYYSNDYELLQDYYDFAGKYSGDFSRPRRLDPAKKEEKDNAKGGFLQSEERALINKKIKDRIGFFSGTEENAAPHFTEDMSRGITHTDLIEYGMLPEFMGRFPILAELNSLAAGDIERIICEPENCVLKQYQEIFRANGKELIIEDDVIKWVAREASAYGTGARAIRTVMEALLNPIMYDCFMETDTQKRVLINMDTIAGFCEKKKTG